MKKLILILHFAFCILPFAFAQQYGWIDLSPNIPDSNNIYKSLRDVYFIGQEGWISGGYYTDAKIYHTSDGGLTFTSQPLPANTLGNGMSIAMRSLQEGYFVTNNGHVLRTLDGGNSWMTIGTGLGLLYSISFPPLPDTSGYICAGSGGKVCRVTGNTVTIEFTTPATLTSIVFPVNSTDGWVCGGTVIRHRTSAGWHPDQNYSTGEWYNGIHFVDNLNGWSVGVPNWKGKHGTIIHTSNGTDWIFQTDPDTNNLNDVFFLNTQEGWAVGNEVILHTTDGSVTWTKEPTSVTDSTLLLSVFAVNNHEVYITGRKYGANFNRALLLKYTQVSGIEDKSVVDFTVYPNPVQDNFRMQDTKCKMVDCDIELLDLSGRKVMKVFKGRIPSDGKEFDMSHLPPGIYFCRISTSNSIVTKKIVKL
ncbi:MAG: YCF48-related protein [Bacteroidetes bacterium]|nr:YCF48-related protein [Bacteroidota bacterium]